MTPLLTINRNILKPVFRVVTPSLCCIVAGMLLALSGTGVAELSMPLPPKTKKKNAPPLPPQGVPVSVKVDPGGTVEIFLKVYGRQWKGMKYLVRTQPKLGKIVSLTPTDKDAIWILTYRHTSPMTEGGDLHDRILFVAQDDDGTSAPTEIAITVADAPAQLVAPKSIDFGKIPAGLPVIRHFVLSNEGGHVVEGEIAVDGPWTLEPTDYRLARGEKAGFRLRFTPDFVQEYRGFLRIPGIKDPIVIGADAFAPFTVEPVTLDLVSNPNNLLRTGSLNVTNQTDTEQTIHLESDARLSLPGEISLKPGESKAVPVKLEDVAAFEGSIRFTVAKVSQRIPVKAVEIGPRLRSQTQKVDFGNVDVGHRHELKVRVENWGGASASIVAYAPPPFEVNPAKFELEAGKEAEIVLGFSPSWAGPLNTVLKFQAGDLFLDLPISAEVTARTKIAPLTVPLTSSQPTPEGPKHSVTTDAAFRIEVATIAKTWAEIFWPPLRSHSTEEELSYRLEARSIALDAGGGARISWVPMPGTTLVPLKDKITAKLEEIPRGAAITLRVAALDSKGKEIEMTPQITLSFPPAQPIFTFQRLLLAGFTLLLGGALWLRSGRAIFGIRIR